MSTISKFLLVTLAVGAILGGGTYYFDPGFFGSPTPATHQHAPGNESGLTLGSPNSPGSTTPGLAPPSLGAPTSPAAQPPGGLALPGSTPAASPNPGLAMTAANQVAPNSGSLSLSAPSPMVQAQQQVTAAQSAPSQAMTSTGDATDDSDSTTDAPGAATGNAVNRETAGQTLRDLNKQDALLERQKAIADARKSIAESKRDQLKAEAEAKEITLGIDHPGGASATNMSTAAPDANGYTAPVPPPKPVLLSQAELIATVPAKNKDGWAATLLMNGQTFNVQAGDVMVDAKVASVTKDDITVTGNGDRRTLILGQVPPSTPVVAAPAASPSAPATKPAKVTTETPSSATGSGS